MKAPDIFYIEDDADFVFFMENAVKEVDSNIQLSVAYNGSEALAHLNKRVLEQQKPGLILIDLNLPGLSGLEILKTIKESPELKYIPTLFFTTSDNPKDLKDCIDHGANAFLTKPDGYEKLVNCVQSLCEFWFKHHNNNIN